MSMFDIAQSPFTLRDDLLEASRTNGALRRRIGLGPMSVREAQRVLMLGTQREWVDAHAFLWRCEQMQTAAQKALSTMKEVVDRGVNEVQIPDFPAERTYSCPGCNKGVKATRIGDSASYLVEHIEKKGECKYKGPVTWPRAPRAPRTEEP
jgi:hypothetical protein